MGCDRCKPCGRTWRGCDAFDEHVGGVDVQEVAELVGLECILQAHSRDTFRYTFFRVFGLTTGPTHARQHALLIYCFLPISCLFSVAIMMILLPQYHREPCYGRWPLYVFPGLPFSSFLLLDGSYGSLLLSNL